MRGIKIPPQDFPLKMQGGLMHEGGRICGTLRYFVYNPSSLSLNPFSELVIYLTGSCLSNFVSILPLVSYVSPH